MSTTDTEKTPWLKPTSTPHNAQQQPAMIYAVDETDTLVKLPTPPISPVPERREASGANGVGEVDGNGATATAAAAAPTPAEPAAGAAGGVESWTPFN